MKDKIEERLKTLKAEYEAGQKMVADLDARRASLTQTMLRIEGAMHVLSEMAAPEESPPPAKEEGVKPVALE